MLREILHRYFALDRPDAAETVYRSAVGLCEEVLAVAEPHTARALKLLLRHPGLPARDAVHVATMEDRGIRLILSADRDFDRLEQVRRVDPADFPA